MTKKNRVGIPKEVAARVLFLSDRTCCVCRREGKPVQIHHIDEDPSHNEYSNLSVLCFDCHRETQIRGGFDRKLDSEQIILYRDDWHAIVSKQRAQSREATKPGESDGFALIRSTSVAEIYRENREYELLAIHYDVIGNTELRDKYIDLVLADNPSDSSVCFLRGLQDRPDRIPQDVLQRELDRHGKHEDYTQRARLRARVGQTKEAAIDYVQGILRSLKDDNVFSAAFYIKELAKDGVLEDLFILALELAKNEGDLWWQVRALQELGWDDELELLLREHKDEIEQSDELHLKQVMVGMIGDQNELLELEKQLAKREHIGEGGGVCLTDAVHDTQTEEEV